MGKSLGVFQWLEHGLTWREKQGLWYIREGLATRTSEEEGWGWGSWPGVHPDTSAQRGLTE